MWSMEGTDPDQTGKGRERAAGSALYIVATPIGNLGDMVPRAVEVLQTVDLVLAEDTRHSRKLLQHFLIDTPMAPCHEHNESARVKEWLARIESGESIALISDAGTPLVSDPGYHLVKQAHEAGIRVIPVPGPCAFVAALCASGLPSGRVLFEGFLPAKGSARRSCLENARNRNETLTLVFYESPHRIRESLEDMHEIFGSQIPCTLARELTKQYETILSSNIQGVLDKVQNDKNMSRGEFVILLSLEGQQALVGEHECEKMLGLLMEELSASKAASVASKLSGLPRRKLYDMAVEISQADNKTIDNKSDNRK
jgi:16S rRNA (cytidine1402-2'-O)-methyltransferase